MDEDARWELALRQKQEADRQADKLAEKELLKNGIAKMKRLLDKQKRRQEKSDKKKKKDKKDKKHRKNDISKKDRDHKKSKSSKHDLGHKDDRRKNESP